MCGNVLEFLQYSSFNFGQRFFVLMLFDWILSPAMAFLFPLTFSDISRLYTNHHAPWNLIWWNNRLVKFLPIWWINSKNYPFLQNESVTYQDLLSDSTIKVTSNLCLRDTFESCLSENFILLTVSSPFLPNLRKIAIYNFGILKSMFAYDIFFIYNGTVYCFY